jgi:thiamine-monophosphate kinase
VSDGLLGDLAAYPAGLEGSGATLETPLNATQSGSCWFSHSGLAQIAGIDARKADWNTLLAGGDDYELAFTAPASAREAVQAAARQADKHRSAGSAVSTRTPACGYWTRPARRFERRYASFDHFA